MYLFYISESERHFTIAIEIESQIFKEILHFSFIGHSVNGFAPSRISHADEPAQVFLI